MENLSKELQSKSILAFILGNELVTERSEPIEFYEHGFLIDLYEDWSPRIAVQKSSQIGVSLMLVLKALYAAKFRGYNVIYTLPSATFVRKFVPDKVENVISRNPELEEWKTGKDSTEQKQIADRTIYFDSAYVNESEMAEADLGIALTADLCIHDECNRSSLSIIDQYESRLDYSDYKGQWHVSNPTYPNVGVSKWWNKSDQKHWFITCRNGHWQYMDWEENVNREERKYVCKKCGAELTNEDRRSGQWVKKWQKRDVSGYWINQMMAPWLSCADLLRKEDSQEPQVFYNFTLGMPYMGSEVVVDQDLILSNCTDRESSKLKVYMGVDTGITKHVVVGTKHGIFKHFATDSWDDIERVFQTYNATMVIDAMPDITVPRKLAEKYRGRVYVNYYRRDRPDRALVQKKRDKKRGILVSDRNRLIQRVIDAFADHKIKLHYRSKELTEYVKHWTSMYKIIDEDTIGNPTITWESSTGEDHFCHASCYWWLAKELHAREGFVGKKSRKIHGRPSFEIDEEGNMPAVPIEYEKPTDEEKWKYV